MSIGSDVFDGVVDVADITKTASIILKKVKEEIEETEEKEY